MFTRIKSSLLLAPAILLLLVWMGRFLAPQEVMVVGVVPFLLWSALSALTIAYFVTMFISYLVSRYDRLSK